MFLLKILMTWICLPCLASRCIDPFSCCPRYFPLPLLMRSFFGGGHLAVHRAFLRFLLSSFSFALVPVSRSVWFLHLLVPRGLFSGSVLSLALLPRALFPCPPVVVRRMLPFRSVPSRVGGFLPSDLDSWFVAGHPRQPVGGCTGFCLASGSGFFSVVVVPHIVIPPVVPHISLGPPPPSWSPCGARVPLSHWSFSPLVSPPDRVCEAP